MDKNAITLNHLDSFTKGQYEETKRLIRSAMGNHNLVLFIGAGTSLDSGMPSWGKAVSVIAERLNLSPHNMDNMKIPQYYFNSRGQNDYNQLIHDIFKFGINLPTKPVHKKILDFDTDVIVTTNYDHLLERAAEEIGQVLCVVSKDNELPYKCGKTLIKMHGDFENGNFVLKEDDYMNYDQNFRLIKNYITSLAGTKTLLFVGYSFSDPDLRQIFAWLKSILQNDFKQAYMISIGDYDRNEEEYYKNWGINTIYAGMFQEKGEILSKTEKVNRVLDWLLQNDSQRTILDRLWEEIGGYRFMKVPYTNHVIDVLQRYFNVSCISCKDLDPGNFSNGFNLAYTENLLRASSFTLSQHDDWEESLILFLKLCFIANEAANDYDGREVIESEEWYQLLDRVRHSENGLNITDDKGITNHLNFTSKEQEKIKTLLHILRKSGLWELKVFCCGSKKEVVIPVFPADNKLDEIFNAMNLFDIQKLEELKKTREQLLTGGDPDANLMQAHLCYFLGDYFKAYTLSRQAAYLYYSQSNFAGYFIAKCNQRYSGQQASHFKVSNDVTENIKKEWPDLDLDKIFDQIPNLTGNFLGKNEFLKEFYSFRLTFDLLQNVVTGSEKVDEEAKTNYIVYGGIPAYHTIRIKVKNFYNYQQKNHAFTDRFEDIKMIYSRAAIAIISSALTEDKVQDITVNPVAIPTYNVHEKEIQVFELFLAIRYLSVREIERIFQGHKTGKLSSKGMKYLSMVAENLSKNFEESRRFSSCLSSLFMICSHVELNEQLIRSVLLAIISLLSTPGRFREYFREIYNFIGHLRGDWLGEKNRESSNVLLELVNKIIDVLPLYSEPYVLGELTDLTSLSLSILNQFGIVHDESEKVQKLLERTDISKASFFIYVYPHCSVNTQELIREWIKNWTPKDSIEDYLTYTVAVRGGIFPMSAEWKENFDSLLHEKNAYYLECKKKGEICSKNQDIVRLILSLVSIALMGKMQEKDWIINICNDYQLKSALWLLNMDNEEQWKDFQLGWLNQCDPALLQNIAEKQEWKSRVVAKIREEYLKRKLDDGVMEKYFKYFV